jgi:pimeloyl-ACP methyl ester carboxylesterase
MSRTVQEELVLGRKRLGLRRTPGRGKPVVMLHGLMDSSESWDPFARSLSRPTFAFDLPGFGESSVAGEDFDEWLELFERAFDALGIEDCFLLGHSLGGAVATGIAADRPDLTKGLLLIAPAGFGRLPLAHIIGRPEIEFLLGRTAPGAMRFKPVVQIAYRSLFSHGHEISEPLMKRLIEQRITMIPGIRQGLHILRKLSHEPFSESPFEGPVHVLLGEYDHMVPKGRTLKGIGRVFPDADETVLEDIGHHPQEECPDITLRWIAEYTDSKVTEPLMLEHGVPFG